MRKADSYRGARRNFAREHNLLWRKIPRTVERGTGEVTVVMPDAMLPQASSTL